MSSKKLASFWRSFWQIFFNFGSRRCHAGFDCPIHAKNTYKSLTTLYYILNLKYFTFSLAGPVARPQEEEQQQGVRGTAHGHTRRGWVMWWRRVCARSQLRSGPRGRHQSLCPMWLRVHLLLKLKVTCSYMIKRSTAGHFYLTDVLLVRDRRRKTAGKWKSWKKGAWIFDTIARVL